MVPFDSDRRATPMKLKYLTRRQATVYLRENGITVSDGYLAQGARLGTGPQFRYLGKHPVYTKADLDAWIEVKKAGVLEAFLQRERLRLGPPTRTARRDPARSHPRRKRTASELSLPP
jgi:hypothetical protein